MTWSGPTHGVEAHLPAGATLAGFGSRLRLARLASGWSQHDLAREAGCSQASVCKHEAGAVCPKPAMVASYAFALCVSTEWLWKIDLRKAA